MSLVLTNVKVGNYEAATPGLIACNHCGIIALDTPAFGWARWYDEDGDLAHHCPAARQYNEYVSQGLVHMKAPDEAIEYGFWPNPDIFYLVNYENAYVDGPFVGRDEALKTLNEMEGEARSATAVLTDAEYHTYKQDLALRNGN
jgi:hypothetical protein